MDSSIAARYVMIAILFAAACVVVYANLRILVFLALRRKVGLQACIIWPLLGLLLVFCIFDTVFLEPNRIQVTRHAFITPKLPAGSRVRIVQLSDLHVESLSGREITMCTLVAAQKPNVIVLTGDYSNAQTEAGLRQIAQRLRRVAPVYAAGGNWDTPQDVEALRQGGVEFIDDWTTLKCSKGAKIALGQVSWIGCSRVRVNPSTARLYKVLLCHVPNCFDSAAESHVDLLLVGHTHGGQLRIPVFGALLPDRRLVGRYQAGIYRQGATVMYVNRGIGMEGGTAPRVRFCCRPEIAVFDIVGKED